MIYTVYASSLCRISGNGVGSSLIPVLLSNFNIFASNTRKYLSYYYGLLLISSGVFGVEAAKVNFVYLYQVYQSCGPSRLCMKINTLTKILANFLTLSNMRSPQRQHGRSNMPLGEFKIKFLIAHWKLDEYCNFVHCHCVKWTIWCHIEVLPLIILSGHWKGPKIIMRSSMSHW